MDKAEVECRVDTVIMLVVEVEVELAILLDLKSRLVSTNACSDFFFFLDAKFDRYYLIRLFTDSLNIFRSDYMPRDVVIPYFSL